MIVDVIIPAYNEEQAIGHVINDIPKHLVREIVVVNNNSTDQTASAAVANGAVVVNAPLRGYGNACLQGLKYLRGKSVIPDVVVFIDGDYSDFPNELNRLLQPLINNQADFVVGSLFIASLFFLSFSLIVLLIIYIYTYFTCSQ